MSGTPKSAGIIESLLTMNPPAANRQPPTADFFPAPAMNFSAASRQPPTADFLLILNLAR